MPVPNKRDPFVLRSSFSTC